LLDLTVEVSRETPIMLNHLLAGIVGLGSLSLFLSGFFLPEVRRKPDFAWSGVALLYALMLWIEGDRTPGGALLGHIFSVALIVWFGWQTLQQRRQFANPEDQTMIPNSLETLNPFLKEGWGRIIVASGEASGWVKNQLGKDDTSISQDALIQQPQDNKGAEDEWNASSSLGSSPSASVVTAASEPLIADPTPEAAPSEAENHATAVPEAPESETHDHGAETEPTVESEGTSHAEESQTAIASHQESTDESPTNPESHPLESKADDAISAQAPAATHQEDDESWPPPDPVT
jgi:Ycf66 protein N-terminus